MTPPKIRPQAELRSAYREFYDMQTRWSDMDIYGHVNNVVYMQYCDAALNRSLIAAGALELKGNTPIGVVARSTTNYFSKFLIRIMSSSEFASNILAIPACFGASVFSEMVKSRPQQKASMYTFMLTVPRGDPFRLHRN